MARFVDSTTIMDINLVHSMYCLFKGEDQILKRLDSNVAKRSGLIEQISNLFHTMFSNSCFGSFVYRKNCLLQLLTNSTLYASPLNGI